MADGRAHGLVDRSSVSALLPDVDWSRTSIGEPASWPQAWRAAVRLVLDSSFPMGIALGPDLLAIYNDACIPILDGKHPGLGRPIRELYEEIWSELEPLYTRVLATGASTQLEDRSFLLRRRGALEECYFTLSVSAIRDDDDVPSGVLTTVLETTNRVLIQRAFTCVEALDSYPSVLESAAGLAERALGILATHETMIRGAAVYLRHGDSLRVASRFGFRQAPWSDRDIEEVAAHGASRVSRATNHAAYAVPLHRPGGGTPEGVLVVSATYRRREDQMLGFLLMFSRHLAVAVGNIQHRDAEREARQAAEIASRAKNEFLTMISHELRNPLTAILGWTAQLKTGTADRYTVLSGIAAIEHSARAQRHLVDELLDVTQLASGELRLEQELLPNVGALIEAVVDAWRPVAHLQGVRLRCRTCGTAGPARVDPARLEQVLWNLLTNALKFTPAGGEVDVQCAPIGDRVVIDVRDTGPGVPEEDRTRIFERFYQSPHAGGRLPGFGLGLAIVREIVERHGGTIEALAARPGPGAVFRIRLPLETTLTGAGTPEPASADDPVPPLRVLLVEDDRSAAEALRRLLQSDGHDVRVVATVADAERAAAAAPLDLLISDTRLPDGSGLDLLPRLRRAVPSASVLPSILLSGFTSPADLQAALAAGYDEHIAKPYEAAELLSAVRRVTRAHRL